MFLSLKKKKKNNIYKWFQIRILGLFILALSFLKGSTSENWNKEKAEKDLIGCWVLLYAKCHYQNGCNLFANWDPWTNCIIISWDACSKAESKSTEKESKALRDEAGKSVFLTSRCDIF